MVYLGVLWLRTWVFSHSVLGCTCIGQAVFVVGTCTEYCMKRRDTAGYKYLGYLGNLYLWSTEYTVRNSFVRNTFGRSGRRFKHHCISQQSAVQVVQVQVQRCKGAGVISHSSIEWEHPPACQERATSQCAKCAQLPACQDCHGRQSQDYGRCRVRASERPDSEAPKGCTLYIPCSIALTFFVLRLSSITYRDGVGRHGVGRHNTLKGSTYLVDTLSAYLLPETYSFTVLMQVYGV
jgi:hypothetical protein